MVLEGFGRVRSLVFLTVIEKCDFVKNSVSPRREHDFKGFELLKNREKTAKNG